MHLTSAALALSLSGFAFAAPLSAPLDGVKIPITKHSSLSNPDGTVNHAALVRHLANAEAKLQRGQAAMEQNAVSTHTTSIHIDAAVTNPSGSVPLADDASKLWQGTISVGNPPVSYTVDFDTGSSDLFLPGRDCGPSCSNHHIYNPSASNASKDLDKTFTLRYGDGSSVEGEQWIDTVEIAGLIAHGQTLGVANQYSTGFAASEFPPDGLMGMAFQSISVYGASPVFQTLVTEGATNPVFSFKLASSGSELVIGASNPVQYTGAFTYAPVIEKGYWKVVMDSVKVGTKTALNATAAVIDTGTTLIVGDAASVATLYSSIPGSQQTDSGYYTVPCSSIPSVSLTFGGKSFPISPSTFNLGRVSPGSPMCVTAIVSGNVGSVGWIVGDVFLQNVYTTFDFGNARVGFATLA